MILQTFLSKLITTEVFACTLVSYVLFYVRNGSGRGSKFFHV